MEELICVFLIIVILWLAAASAQEPCIRFLPVTVCVMAYMEWRGNSKIFGEEGLRRTFLMKMRLFLFTFYNINYNFLFFSRNFQNSIHSVVCIQTIKQNQLFEVQVKFIFLLRKKQITKRH